MHYYRVMFKDEQNKFIITTNDGVEKEIDNPIYKSPELWKYKDHVFVPLNGKVVEAIVLYEITKAYANKKVKYPIKEIVIKSNKLDVSPLLLNILDEVYHITIDDWGVWYSYIDREKIEQEKIKTILKELKQDINKAIN